MPKEKQYADRLEDGNNYGKLEEDQIHPLYQPTKFTIYDIPPFRLIAEIDEYITSFRYMTLFDYQIIINDLGRRLRENI